MKNNGWYKITKKANIQSILHFKYSYAKKISILNAKLIMTNTTTPTIEIRQNNVIYVVYQTDGSGGGNADVRKNEARNALNILNPNIIMRVASLPFYKTKTRTLTELDIEAAVKEIELSSKFAIICSILFSIPKIL